MRPLLLWVVDVTISMKTAAWLLGAQLLLFLAGAFQMPSMKAYSSMNSMPLFQWMQQTPVQVTWWLWASVIVMGLLALNTIACSIHALIQKRQGRHFLLIISPQVIHFGFMLMLLAHLLSASGGFKANFVVSKGKSFTLSGGEALRIMDVRMTLSPRGMPLDYYVDASFFSPDGVMVKEHRIAPNHPAFFRGMGFYVKEVRGRQALIEVTRDPGTPFALGGGALFSLGTVALVGLKIRRER